MQTVERSKTGLDAGKLLESGYTMPVSWYVDPAFYAAEQERIFRKSWQYVGLQEQVAGVGDYILVHVGGLPFIVTRDQAGSLRAYVNVCRHRGSELVTEPCGTKKALQCPYHAWTFGLDGKLKSAPGMRGEAGFDPAEFSLFEGQVDTWGPFIFVNPDLEAPSLQSVLGELPGFVAETGLRLNEVKRRVRQEFDIHANWKVTIDNYLECYHCPVAHPGLSALIDMDNYWVREFDMFSTQGGPKKELAPGEKEQFDTRGEVIDGFFAYLWPNFTINIYPGPGILSINLFLPVGPGETRAIFDYCFVDEISKEDEDDFVRFIEQVQLEDVVLCDSVQRGLSTGYLEVGKLMAKQESALLHFQHLVNRYMGDAS